MTKQLLIATLASLSLAAGAQPGSFQQLKMENGKDTSFDKYSLRLAEPDNPEEPTVWQGPLSISNGSGSCTADVSLVTGIYAAPARGFVIVLSISGSNTFAYFIDFASCAAKWPPIKRAASAVIVTGDRISFMPVCEGGGNNAPALCTAGRVFLIHDAAPPAYLKSASYKLTARELGVGFSGEARVMDPRTPRAILVH